MPMSGRSRRRCNRAGPYRDFVRVMTRLVEHERWPSCYFLAPSLVFFTSQPRSREGSSLITLRDLTRIASTSAAVCCSSNEPSPAPPSRATVVFCGWLGCLRCG